MATSRIETNSLNIIPESTNSESSSYKGIISHEAILADDSSKRSFFDQEPYDVEAVSAVVDDSLFDNAQSSDDEGYDVDAIPSAVIEHESWLEVDPTNMSPLAATMLTDYLLRSLLNGNFYLPAYKLTQKFITLYSHYDLLWFYNEKHHDRNCFAVVDNKVIGQGGTSAIKKVKGLLKQGADSTFFYKSHKNKPKDKLWVVRYEKHTSIMAFNQSSKSLALVVGNNRLALKPLMLIDEKNNTSACIMRRLKDKNLDTIWQIMEDDPIELRKLLTKYQRWDFNEIYFLMTEGLLKFSGIELLQYSIAMIQAYMEQVLHFNLLHRDIKPENIIIDLGKGPCVEAITFIDFEFACRISTYMQLGVLGTPGFIAPEVLNREILSDNASDIFSLACTLALWYGDASSYDVVEGDYWHQSQSQAKRFNQLSPETPPEVKGILHRMVVSDPLRRSSINTVKRAYEEALENEQFEELITSISPSIKNSS